MMKLKGFSHGLAVFLLLCAFALAVMIASVSAQDQASLAVEPVQVNLPLGNQCVIELTVTNGRDINAFEIKLTYDQERLTLQSWAHGDYFGKSDPNCDTVIKSPGRLELGCAVAGQEVVSGNGILLELVFDTLALGTVDITIAEAAFSDVQGFQRQPDRVNGFVNVQNLPTYTATPTITVTPTFTPTATFTLTPLPNTETPDFDLPTATGTPTLTPSPTETLPSSQSTGDAGLTRTLTTPISGVAAPSRGTSASDLNAPTQSELQWATAVALTQEAQKLALKKGSSATLTPELNQADRDQPASFGDWLSVSWYWLLLGTMVVLALGVILLFIIRVRKQQEDRLLL